MNIINLLTELPTELILHISCFFDTKSIEAFTLTSIKFYQLKELLWKDRYNENLKYIPYYLCDHSYRELCLKYLNLYNSRLFGISVLNFMNSITMYKYPIYNIYKCKNTVLINQNMELGWRRCGNRYRFKYTNNKIPGILYDLERKILLTYYKSRFLLYTEGNPNKRELKISDMYAPHNIIKTCKSNDLLWFLDFEGIIYEYTKSLPKNIKYNYDELPDSYIESVICIDITATNNCCFIINNVGDLFTYNDSEFIKLHNNCINICSSNNALFVTKYVNNVYNIFILGYHPALIHFSHSVICDYPNGETCTCRYELYESSEPILIDCTDNYIILYTSNTLILYTNGSKFERTIYGICKIFAFPKYIAFLKRET